MPKIQEVVVEIFPKCIRAVISFQTEALAQEFAIYSAQLGLVVSLDTVSVNFCAFHQDMIAFYIMLAKGLCGDQEDHDKCTNALIANNLRQDTVIIPDVYQGESENQFIFTRQSRINKLQFVGNSTSEMHVIVQFNDNEAANQVRELMVGQGLVPLSPPTQDVMHLEFLNHNCRNIAHFIHILNLIEAGISLLMPELADRFQLDFNSDLSPRTWYTNGHFYPLNEERSYIKRHIKLLHTQVNASPLSSLSVIEFGGYYHVNHGIELLLTLKADFQFSNTANMRLSAFQMTIDDTGRILALTSTNMHSLIKLITMVKVILGVDFDQIETPLIQVLIERFRIRGLPTTISLESMNYAQINELCLNQAIPLDRFTEELNLNIQTDYALNDSISLNGSLAKAVVNLSFEQATEYCNTLSSWINEAQPVPAVTPTFTSRRAKQKNRDDDDDDHDHVKRRNQASDSTAGSFQPPTCT